jgi:hypothetical protein
LRESFSGDSQDVVEYFTQPRKQNLRRNSQLMTTQPAFQFIAAVLLLLLPPCVQSLAAVLDVSSEFVVLVGFDLVVKVLDVAALVGVQIPPSSVSAVT